MCSPSPTSRSSSLPALAEAARADKNIAARFVPPRTGILEETASRRHQFVFGRRGVGKSTLLRKIESQAPTESHGDVIFVDVETLRGPPLPGRAHRASDRASRLA